MILETVQHKIHTIDDKRSDNERDTREVAEEAEKNRILIARLQEIVDEL